MAEWNPSGFTATGFVEGTGILAHPAEYRFTSVVTQLAQWLEWAPVAVKPRIFLGSAHTGHEVSLFQKHLTKLMEPVAILVTPSEITGAYVSNQLRTQHFWIDSPTMGDVIGGCWDVFLRTRTPMKLTIVQNPIAWGDRVGGSIRVHRATCRRRPTGGKTQLRHPIFYWSGHEVVILDRSREFRVLGSNSHIAAQSLADIWQRGLHLPLFAATHTRPSMTDQIVIFGGLGEMGKPPRTG